MSKAPTIHITYRHPGQYLKPKILEIWPIATGETTQKESATWGFATRHAPIHMAPPLGHRPQRFHPGTISSAPLGPGGRTLKFFLLRDDSHIFQEQK